MIPETYLDLHDIFVNEVAGSAFLFLLLAYVLLFYLAARFRFPNIVTLIFMVIFTLVLSPFLNQGLLVISLLIIAVYFAINLYRTFMRE